MINVIVSSRGAGASRFFYVRNRLLWALALATSALTTQTSAGEIYDWKGGKTPALTLVSVSGESQTLAAYKGKVVLVNFWATWCEPCVAEMPSLQGLRDRSNASGLEVLGVNLGEATARVAPFVQKLGIRFPILLDRDGEAKRDWKVGGVPVTFVVDRQGVIRFRIVGEADFAEPALLARIDRLLAQRPTGRPTNLSQR